MQRYRDTKLVDLLVNLTNEPISIYEESSGNIYSLIPCGDGIELSSIPVDFGEDGFVIFYIVDEDELEKVKLSGRQIDDIALVREKSQGRNGREISYLMWAADRNMCVRLRYGVRTRQNAQ